MAHFDEKSGVVPCLTPWGKWYQTMEEIFIEVNAPEGTTSKMVKVIFGSKQLACTVRGEELIKGELSAAVISDECTWTLEDNKLIVIVLVKSSRLAENCWHSLLKDQYTADPYIYDQMEKKLTLQRFQHENPGFDFSGAEITGNYSHGGPTFDP
ncbi:nudC domain-containing protein 2-like isoform X1 [Asterias rubens]|uniref:nudC domain-containing protein 2-like isoform X1 n=1 Tax=Asterias rubens TaxID=7604 RepID=UPI0014554FB4|nr:nudC domain-containing protein 2-like isoform X1 [Asterias rubens]XP_033632143.1 nudC domain-containing protein 2-like isoform X1 [Asterias rubens]XP_033632144.1 nudC domain-containing protein 2-like isoform X1 [Asterias rubens]XP_033632145.1 nudC domain-containing protein 2-like isoform X1 [Asterias rubens]